jgi:hypothetical protein
MPHRDWPDPTPPEDRGPDGTLRLRCYLKNADSTWFAAGCTTCGRSRPIGVRPAVEIMGTAEASVGELERLLRCTVCGGKRVQIVVAPDTRSPEDKRLQGPLPQTLAGLGPEE